MRCLTFRFEAFGREITNRKKFEEGIFSDLRNLKCDTDAVLEQPKSEFLDFLYRNNCVRTQKKQKIFYWFSVNHDRLFQDALERDLKKELANKRSSTTPVRDPAISFQYDSTRTLHDQLPDIIEKFPRPLAELADASSVMTNISLPSGQAIQIPPYLYPNPATGLPHHHQHTLPPHLVPGGPADQQQIQPQQQQQQQPQQPQPQQQLIVPQPPLQGPTQIFVGQQPPVLQSNGMTPFITANGQEVYLSDPAAFAQQPQFFPGAPPLAPAPPHMIAGLQAVPIPQGMAAASFPPHIQAAMAAGVHPGLQQQPQTPGLPPGIHPSAAAAAMAAAAAAAGYPVHGMAPPGYPPQFAGQGMQFSAIPVAPHMIPQEYAGVVPVSAIATPIQAPPSATFPTVPQQTSVVAPASSATPLTATVPQHPQLYSQQHETLKPEPPLSETPRDDDGLPSDFPLDYVPQIDSEDVSQFDSQSLLRNFSSTSDFTTNPTAATAATAAGAQMIPAPPFTLAAPPVAPSKSQEETRVIAIPVTTAGPDAPSIVTYNQSQYHVMYQQDANGSYTPVLVPVQQQPQLQQVQQQPQQSSPEVQAAAAPKEEEEEEEESPDVEIKSDVNPLLAKTVKSKISKMASHQNLKQHQQRTAAIANAIQPSTSNSNISSSNGTVSGSSSSSSSSSNSIDKLEYPSTHFFIPTPSESGCSDLAGYQPEMEAAEVTSPATAPFRQGSLNKVQPQTTVVVNGVHYYSASSRGAAFAAGQQGGVVGTTTTATTSSEPNGGISTTSAGALSIGAAATMSSTTTTEGTVPADTRVATAVSATTGSASVTANPVAGGATSGIFDDYLLLNSGDLDAGVGADLVSFGLYRTDDN